MPCRSGVFSSVYNADLGHEVRKSMPKRPSAHTFCSGENFALVDLHASESTIYQVLSMLTSRKHHVDSLSHILSYAGFVSQLSPIRQSSYRHYMIDNELWLSLCQRPGQSYSWLLVYMQKYFGRICTCIAIGDALLFCRAHGLCWKDNAQIRWSCYFMRSGLCPLRTRCSHTIYINIQLITIFISVLKQEPEERHAPEILCITWRTERLQTVLNNTLLHEPCFWVEVGQSLWQQFLILNWLQITDWMIFTILYLINEWMNIDHECFIARTLFTSVSWYRWSGLRHK